ncbi:MAG TPA: hypothetical protein IAC80_08875 [Candidatus Merdiplasma excrementigallinarum]|uniref:Tubulin like n=1 Tax=Candidatus Merdiplasma excrementigallinarum TaxID=2840864 RepID=A0A9D1P0Z4_9FIRM|nr:hypothetical protein [Candidatus Merdiplasma excrementigallinarum]
MGLSEEYKKRIQESLDAETGGRLHAIAAKATAVKAPVLIIGLGGTGMDALRITKKLIYDTIQSEKKDGEYTDKPKNIEYLGIDTDEGEEKKSYQGMYLNKTAGEIQIYTMPHVQPVLAHPELLPPYINSWLNTNIDTQTVISGAGAVRQLGRLLLMQNLSKVQTILESKIKKATSGFDTNVPMYVFILAGISGGTGSGTFLDMPYLVKAVSETNDGRPVRNVGILFMPDVNAGKSGVDNVKRESIYANGYAALKELDYLQKIEEVGDTFVQTYGTLRTGMTGEKPIPPYDICLLMSSRDVNGTSYGTGDENYAEVIHVAAETIFNFVLGDDGAADYTGFSIQSFLSNEVSNINTYKTQLGNLRHPVSYLYSIAGASSARLPIDDIMSYLTYKAFQEVQRYWDLRPQNEDVDQLLAFFKLSKGAVVNGGRARVKFPDTSRVDYKAVKERAPQVIQLYETAFAAQQKVIKENFKLMQEGLEEQIRDDNNLINQIFLDLTKGPVFAQQCLYTADPQRRSVITDLRRMNAEFMGEILQPEQMNVLEGNANAALNKIRNGSSIMGHKKELQEYLDAMNAWYNAKFRNELYGYAASYCSGAANTLTEKNNHIYDIVAELLDTLVKIFDKYGKIKTNAVEIKGEKGTTLTWSLVDTPAFIREVEARMENNPEFAVNLQEVVANFYHYLFENTELWTGNRKEDVVENINGFIYKQFNNILNHSMDFFLAMIAQSQNKTLNQYCDEIIQELRKRAQVHFPIDHAFSTGAVTQPSYSFISVPSNSPQLLQAAKNVAATTVTVGGAASIVKGSGINDRIFMMNFLSATPLSLYADLKHFYEKYKTHQQKPGLHLYEKNSYNEVDWKYLPSPYPETEWVAFDDPTERQINDFYRGVLAKGLAYGYVTENPMAGTMTCRWGEQTGWQEILEQFGVKPDESAAIPSNEGGRLVRALQERLENPAARCSETLTRTEMVTDDNHTELKKEYEEIIFIQMFKVRDRIKEMVEDHERCAQILEQIKSRVVDDSSAESFILCRLLGLISCPKFTDYVYEDYKGVYQPLISLTGAQANFAEHYLLNAFMGLEDTVRDQLSEKARSLLHATEDIAGLRADFEDFTQVRIKEPTESQAFKYGWKDMADGEKILSSYQILKQSADNVMNMLGPSKPSGRKW